MLEFEEPNKKGVTSGSIFLVKLSCNDQVGPFPGYINTEHTHMVVIKQYCAKLNWLLYGEMEKNGRHFKHMSFFRWVWKQSLMKTATLSLRVWTVLEGTSGRVKTSAMVKPVKDLRFTEPQLPDDLGEGSLS